MDSSRTSTTCSSPNNDSVEKMIKNDHVRYTRKGYGLIMAAVTAIGFFTLVPALLREVYPSLIEGQDIVKFTTLTVCLVPIVTNLLCYAASWVIYTSKTPFLERYRISNKPWPWEVDSIKWRALLKKSLALWFLNQVVIFAAFVIAEAHISGIVFRVDTETMPSFKEIVLQISFCMFVEDFCFYWGHRLLHHPKIYPRIHKIHHSYNNTVSIANEYAHPIEFILSNMIPSSLGPKILGHQCHIITLWLWSIIRISESVDGHCGYEFSWSPFRLLPFSGSSIYHNYHHSANIGNFGSFFTIWDTVFGTNRHYFVWLSKREKEDQLNQIRNNFVDMKKKLQNDPSHQIAQLNELNKVSADDIHAVAHKIQAADRIKAE